jgi:hypothetical protein
MTIFKDELVQLKYKYENNYEFDEVDKVTFRQFLLLSPKMSNYNMEHKWRNFQSRKTPYMNQVISTKIFYFNDE